jgi:hypothetical protein
MSGELWVLFRVVLGRGLPGLDLCSMYSDSGKGHKACIRRVAIPGVWTANALVDDAVDPFWLAPTTPYITISVHKNVTVLPYNTPSQWEPYFKKTL